MVGRGNLLYNYCRHFFRIPTAKPRGYTWKSTTPIRYEDYLFIPSANDVTSSKASDTTTGWWWNNMFCQRINFCSQLQLQLQHKCFSLFHVFLRSKSIIVEETNAIAIPIPIENTRLGKFPKPIVLKGFCWFVVHELAYFPTENLVKWVICSCAYDRISCSSNVK